MSIAEKPAPSYSADQAAPPPLENGDRLTRDEFERRSTAMPHLKKAELLRGIVYMPSPVRMDRHGEPQSLAVGWLFNYMAATPGVRTADNSTVCLGVENEPQPDALLMIPRERGGQAFIGKDGYLHGAPELAVEVASSSVCYDSHVKLEVYRDYGVGEYLLWRVNEEGIDWLALRGDRYEPLVPGADGILRSELFPGLWLDPAVLIARDAARLVAVLQEGLASPEHAAFVAKLAALA